MKKALLLTSSLTLLFLVVLAGFLLYQARDFITSPGSEKGEEKIILIPSGAGFKQIALELEKHGLVSSALKFRLYAKLTGKDHLAQAGEFKLNTGWSPPRILEALTSGETLLHRIRIPEGLTWWQTAEVVADTGLTTHDKFARAVRDKDLLTRYHIPGDNAEGFLFPETYSLPRPKNGNAEPIVEAMLQEFWKNVHSDLLPNRATPEEILRLVTIASLVEKETSAPEERPRVAGVYLNRMKRGMRLQADPTIIYGLGTEFTGNLKKKHLTDRENPYNTYAHDGLPPGPICSPGLASLKAVAEPEEHSYLYFVSKGDGTHVFSRTLAEHNKAVYKYQIRRNRN
ncbi:MAG: endolytic transglycosylase MltG [Desulfovibrionales bacterium]